MHGKIISHPLTWPIIIICFVIVYDNIPFEQLLLPHLFQRLHSRLHIA